VLERIQLQVLQHLVYYFWQDAVTCQVATALQEINQIKAVVKGIQTVVVQLEQLQQ